MLERNPDTCFTVTTTIHIFKIAGARYRRIRAVLERYSIYQDRLIKTDPLEKEKVHCNISCRRYALFKLAVIDQDIKRNKSLDVLRFSIDQPK